MNVDVLISMVNDMNEAERDYNECCRKIRLKYKIPAGSTIWIPSLSGSDAHLLGAACERAEERANSVAKVCHILSIDQDLLIATIKSLNRWENHKGFYDRHVYLEIRSVRERMLRALSEKNKEKQCYTSTGRLKSWCAPVRK